MIISQIIYLISLSNSEIEKMNVKISKGDILLQMSTHPPVAGNPKHPVAGSGDGISYHHCNTGEGELGAAPHNTGIQVLEWWLCLL